MEFALGFLVAVVALVLFKYRVQISALSLVLKEMLFPSKMPTNYPFPISPVKPPVIHPDLTRLWGFAAKEAKAAGMDERYVQLALGNIGLNLTPQPSQRTGGIEPQNSLCFAGSDEVEFGFLQVEGLSLSQCPIVMTAFEYTNHVVVGESLLEFLALGSNVGFDALDACCSFIEEVRKNPSAKLKLEPRFKSKDIDALLARLRQEFQLKPWDDMESRLRDLDKRWAHFIKSAESAEV